MPYNSKSKENLLQPWKPGISANPLGRPKGRISLTKLLQERLKDRHFFNQPTPDGRLVGEWLIDAMIGHAIKSGNANLFQQIMDRNDGKVPEIVETETRDVVKKAAAKARDRKRTRRTDGSTS